MKESIGQILERYRDGAGLSISAMSEQLGISRPAYYAWLKGAEADLKTLSTLAVDHAGEWLGHLAVELIDVIDPRMVPCVCQTEVGDSGMCPKHSRNEAGLRAFFASMPYEELRTMVVMPEHKEAWGNELRTRQAAQLREQKSLMRAQAGA